jgi:hypothetical protein
MHAVCDGHRVSHGSYSKISELFLTVHGESRRHVTEGNLSPAKMIGANVLNLILGVWTV